MAQSKTIIPVMTIPLLADFGIGISDMKKNPIAAIAAAEGAPLAILNRNRAAADLIPDDAGEAIMERLDDIELAEIVRQREGQGEVGIPVNIDEL
jgi:antitoxin StbD